MAVVVVGCKQLSPGGVASVERQLQEQAYILDPPGHIPNVQQMNLDAPPPPEEQQGGTVAPVDAV